MLIARNDELHARLETTFMHFIRMALWLLVAGLCSGPLTMRVQAASLTGEQALGKSLFFDTSLSNPGGQSCASCHSSSTSFTDPTHGPTSPGVIPGLFGSRNAPTVLYSALTPAFHYDAAGETYVGGQFLDGRASSLEDQAKLPFLNPVEMANPDKASVIAKLRSGSNATMFRSVFGATSLDNVDQAYDLLSQALADYERSGALSPFSSKYDAWVAGKATLTPQETLGLHVFEDPAKGNCAACHPSTTPSGSRKGALFTDRTYDNIGVPKNPDNPIYTQPAQFNPAGSGFVDIGLGATTGQSTEDGMFKVPTLRDIDMTGPYMHNGYFTTLSQVVDFYNTRDVKPACPNSATTAADAELLGCWPAPEVLDNENLEELGNLGLSSEDATDLLAFLGTLTDGYFVPSVVALEPSSLSLLGVGLAAVGVRRRRRWQATRRNAAGADCQIDQPGRDAGDVVMPPE